MTLRQQLAAAMIRDPRAVKRIAREAGVGTDGVYDIVNNRACNPMLDTLEKLCQALGYRMVIERDKP